MAVEYSLRPMEPADGPALDELMRTEPQTTRFSMSTHYLVDVYRALTAQHSSVIGVVAEGTEPDGLLGMATAFLDHVRLDGQVHPSAHLENLKVRHDVRRRGIGRALAAWRIREARARFGGEGVIATGIEASNTASLATAATWATQVLGPVRVLIARTTARPPRTTPDLEVRAPTDADLDELVDGADRFHADHLLYPPQTTSGLAGSLAPSALGAPHRQYRVAVTPGGAIVAGAGITERFRLMVDHIDHVPLPVFLVGRLTGLIPADRVIRSVEVSRAWHAPGRMDAARQLWDAIRWEWHDRCTNVAAIADPRTSLAQAFHAGSAFAPRVELMVAVQAPTEVDPARPVYLWR